MLGLGVENADARWASLSDRLRMSLWFIPVMFVLFCVFLHQITLRIDLTSDLSNLPFVTFVDDVSTATTVLATIATSMLTFLGVVFSITIVALQLSSSQYSPRVLRTFLRDRITQCTLGAFVATFVFALLVLRNVDPGSLGQEAFIPGLSIDVTIGFVWLSLFWFVVFVHHTTQAIRAVNIIEAVARETRETMRLSFPSAGVYRQAVLPPLGEPTAVIAYHGPGVALGGVETDRLVHLARDRDAVFRFLPQVGDYLPDGQPLLEIHGGTPPTERDVMRCLEVGVERTMIQDVGFGFRQLVDIASRALSPAVNDPTTASQVIDRITDLLARLADCPDPTGVYVDEHDTVRLLRPREGWDAYVELAYTEIRHFGANSHQVCRRLAASLDDLIARVPPERVPALTRQRELLAASVARSFTDPAEFAVAATPDRQGMG